MEGYEDSADQSAMRFARACQMPIDAILEYRIYDQICTRISDLRLVT